MILYVGMKKLILFHFLSLSIFTSAYATPERYIELLPFVQAAPDQGRTGTCLYVASTGAMELIANKKNNIRNPKPYGPFDLSESYLIHADSHPSATDKWFIEKKVLRFNHGFGILAKDWDFDVWNGTRPDRSVWEMRDWSSFHRVHLPKVETIQLFMEGDRWAKDVLDHSHVEIVKEALWKYQSPVLISYNDSGFWHVIAIVGYDDTVPGTCYQTEQSECDQDVGSFYVRDSFGLSVELRDYDWFRKRGNAAIVVREEK
jgi:C1A family cysteine protease